MIDITPWIGSVTALAGMAKAWIELRRAGTDLAKSREAMNTRTAPAGSDRNTSQSNGDGLAVKVVIDAKLLAALLADVRAAADRFSAAINDPRYTPADIDREEQRAELTVRTHINRIREFNAGQLPSEELRQLALSFRCEA
jgi:hypothetical protein